MEKKKRSVGVTIVGIIAIIYGINHCIFSLPLVPMFSSSIRQGHFYQFPLIVLYLMPLIYIVVGINILRLKNWARILGIYAALLTIILSLWQSMGTAGGFLRFFVNLGKESHSDIFPNSELFFTSYFTIPALLFLLFLIRPKVKEQFK